MKHFKQLLFLMLALVSVQSWGQEVDEVINYTFNATSKMATVTSKSSRYSGNVIIPEKVMYNGETYTVASIGNSAFYYCYGLTSVTIPSSVTSIGNSAFDGCTGLTSVTIPSSVTSIGNSAFDGCTGLTSVTIPSSVTSIGSSAFYGCTKLTSVTIPSSVMSIGSSAFSGCTGLTSVTIPSSVTSIGNSAFSGCTGLTSVTILSSVMSIGNSAFAYCTGLTSVTIPSSVMSIGSAAFYGCTGLKEIKVDSDNGNYSSEDGVLFNKDKSIICQYLAGKTGEYSIPESVTSIGEQAFNGCSGLTSVTIPSSVTSIGNNAFASCTGLTSVTIPSSVTSIGNNAFWGCTDLTSVTIPSSVTSIGNQAFYNCTGLTSVTIPSSVTSIGNSAFNGCTNLTSVTIPSSVTSIGNSAFNGCTNLTSVTIPASVTNIGTQTFWRCTGLTSVISLSTAISSSTSSSIFPTSPKLPILYVPEEAKESYGTNWAKYFGTIVEICDSKQNVFLTKDVLEADYSRILNALTPGKITSIDLTGATASAVTEETLNGLNPNCLIYTLENDKNEALSGRNVIRKAEGTDTWTAENITLIDGYDFNCPEEFKATTISYTRTPKVYASTLSNGWQTIVLPFAATGYETEIGFGGDKKISPVTTDPKAGGNFWLRSLATAEKGVVTFESTADGTLKANTPYIISFPGAEFNDNSLQNEGAITFTASNAEVLATDNQTTDGDSHSLIGMYQKQAITQGWILNDANKGAQFDEVTESTLIEPFYAYFRTNKLPGVEEAFPHLLISNKLPTALDEQQETSATLQVLTTPEGVVILASAPGKAAIKNAMGIVVSYLTLEAGSNPVGNLPTGVYFIEGQKFFVQ